MSEFSVHGGIRIKSRRGGDQPTEGLEKEGFSQGSRGCTPVAVARIIADDPNDDEEINQLAPICAEYLGTDETGTTPFAHPSVHLVSCGVEAQKLTVNRGKGGLYPTVAQFCRALGEFGLSFDAILLHTRRHSACIVRDRAYQCGTRHRVKNAAVASCDRNLSGSTWAVRYSLQREKWLLTY